eukprot:gene9279-12501_t
MSLNQLKEYITSYLTHRSEVISTIGSIITKQNQLSYLSIENISTNINVHSIMRPSRLVETIYEEIFTYSLKINSLKFDIINDVKNLETAFLSVKTEAAKFDEHQLTFIENVTLQLKQQSMLEISIMENFITIELLKDFNQDSFVTMMACFKYSPYLRKNDLDFIMEFSTE